MPLASGTTLTHYEILAAIGAGGMGEVYRAKDTRLGREVAIKVLPVEFVEDEERLLRFEREAQTLASLNHPNVAQVFGMDQVDDTCFIAMELVPGEDLAARVKRSPLPLDETLDVCCQIAEGLEAAHEAGVIHRDLKPANVLLARDGKVKLLDFGLAKPVGPAADEDSTVMTGEGTVLGTPPYLSPEQTRGKALDRRTDIWAFGCVLYECLTGKRAFTGRSLPDLLAAIVSTDPEWGALPRTTPPAVRDLLERCLRKDPRKRLRDIGDARIVLEELRDGEPVGTSLPAPSRRSLGPILAVTLVVMTAVAALGWMRSGSPRRESEIVPITFAKEWESAPSWSPTSEFIVYERMVDGSLDLYTRRVDGGTPEPLVTLPGDQNSPRWSPYGDWIAYVSSLEPETPVYLVLRNSEREPVRLIDTGLPPLEVNLSFHTLGIQPWIADDTLLVSTRLPGGQMAVHRANWKTSEVQQLTFPAAGEDDLNASISFDGKQIVFERRAHGRGSLYVLPASGGVPQELLSDGFDNNQPVWRPGDRFVLFNSLHGNYYNLWELDTKRQGEPRMVTNLPNRIWSYAVSQDGRIAFTPIWHDTWLKSIDRLSGEEAILNEHNGDNFGGRFSPDEASRFLAYHSNREGNSDIWRIDAAGNETNLSEDPAIDLYPDWSPGGDRLTFVSDRDGDYKIWIMNNDGTHVDLLLDEPIGIEGSYVLNGALIARWSPDGQRIAYIEAGEKGNDVWTVGLQGLPPQLLLEGVVGFDWWDDRRAVISRQGEPGEPMVLLAIDLERPGETVELYRGAHMEVDVAPDGSGVAFCAGSGHFGMKPFVLDLEPPASEEGLPQAVGEPRQLYGPELDWHVHMGGWSGDSQRIVFSYDRDYSNILELIEAR